jgi:hypothetical protein
MIWTCVKKEGEQSQTNLSRKKHGKQCGENHQIEITSRQQENSPKTFTCRVMAKVSTCKPGCLEGF